MNTIKHHKKVHSCGRKDNVMLNFLTNVLQNQAAPMNTCTPDMDTIQGCIGCDGECLFTCWAMCANECQGETRDIGGGGSGGGQIVTPTCKAQCTGICVSTASLMGIK